MTTPTKFYTGVGSRETPKHILEIMQEVAFKLSQDGWVLRSGGAEGADTAFEIGATNSFADVVPEIYLPWLTFNNHDATFLGVIVPVQQYKSLWAEAEEVAKDVHPVWDRLSSAAKTLHARNVFQVLGKDLNTPSKFLICYAPKQGDSVRGGTRTAYEVAKRWNIPCFNLIEEDVVDRLEIFLKEE